MKIPAKVFRIAFEKVAHLAGKRSGIEILSSVLVSAKSGVLSISASDNVVSATSECLCIDHLEPFCIGASSLAGILNGAGDDEIDFVLEGEKLRVTSPFRVTIPILPGDQFIPFPTPKKSECLGVNCEDLATAIRNVYWAADAKSVAYAYTSSVHIVTSVNQIACTALDGKILAHCEVGSMGAASDVLIPCHCTSELTAALSSENSDYYVSDKHVFGISDGFSVSVRRLESNYPNVQMVLGDSKTTVGSITTKLLKDKLSLCKSVVGDSGSLIRCALEFSKTGLEIREESRDFNASITGEFKDSNVKVNLAYITEVVKHFAQDSINIETSGKFLILSAGDLICYIAQLMSLDQKPKASE